MYEYSNTPTVKKASEPESEFGNLVSIPVNRFLNSLNVYKYGLCINYFEIRNISLIDTHSPHLLILSLVPLHVDSYISIKTNYIFTQFPVFK
jgi:hypothetical protein